MDIKKNENKEFYNEGGYDIEQEICISKDGYKLLFILLMKFGDCGSTVIKVLRYKSESRWFDPFGIQGSTLELC
jgi:hypothetical protein